jgi:hypothetical protein
MLTNADASAVGAGFRLAKRRLRDPQSELIEFGSHAPENVERWPSELGTTSDGAIAGTRGRNHANFRNHRILMDRIAPLDEACFTSI